MKLYEVIGLGLGLLIVFSGLGGIDCFPISKIEAENIIHEGTENSEMSISPVTLIAEDENIPEKIPTFILLTETEIEAGNDIVSISAINYQIMAFIPGAEGDVSLEDDEDVNEDVENDGFVRDFIAKHSTTLIMDMKLVQIEVGDLTESSDDQDEASFIYSIMP